MAFSNDIFMWPSGLHGDRATTQKTWHEIVADTWRSGTWRECRGDRSVLDDHDPIVLAATHTNIDSPKSRRTGQSHIEVWTSDEDAWRVYWLFEESQTHALAKKDPERFLKWIADGMEHLWVLLAVTGTFPVIESCFVLQGVKALRHEAAERMLTLFASHLPALIPLEGRLAIAGDTAGVVRRSAISQLNLLSNLLHFTGREILLIDDDQPIAEASAAIIRAIQGERSETLRPVFLPRFES